MAKAILVMDMPETCEDCKMYYADDEHTNHDGTPRKICTAIDGWAHIEDEYVCQWWCPLIPEPAKAHYVWREETERQKGFAAGYMACYHEIFGKGGQR